jgi:hypothetical protein
MARQQKIEFIYGAGKHGKPLIDIEAFGFEESLSPSLPRYGYDCMLYGT